MKRTKIPPLGCMPRFIHRQRRIVEIKQAMDRFLDSNWPIPIEFVKEYNELVKKLEEEE